MFIATLKIENKLTIDQLEGRNLRYEGKGETIFEALSNIPANYTQIKKRGIIEVSDGQKTVESLLQMQPLRILLNNHLRRSGWARHFNNLLYK